MRRVAALVLAAAGCGRWGFADHNPWPTPDLHTMYFASSRSGQFDIYTATR